MMKSIVECINEEFSKTLKEISPKDSEKILKNLGFKKGLDYFLKNNKLFATNEQTAMDISDEIYGSLEPYDLSYDDDNDFELTLWK